MTRAAEFLASDAHLEPCLASLVALIGVVGNSVARRRKITSAGSAT